jgi:hypothetical protein
MDDREGDVDRVRRSAEFTRAAGTAALRFAPARIDVQPGLGEQFSESHPNLVKTARMINRSTRDVMSRLRVSELPGPFGRIDFQRERCLYFAGGEGWRLSAPGLEFVGEPGRWEQVVLNDDSLERGDPLWLLALIGASIDATDKGSDSVLGERCQRYAAVASFPIAVEQTERSLQPPRQNCATVDVERLPIDVWLDRAGRIRRAIVRCGNLLTILELSDFGVVEHVALPATGEILTDET